MLVRRLSVLFGQHCLTYVLAETNVTVTIGDSPVDGNRTLRNAPRLGAMATRNCNLLLFIGGLTGGTNGGDHSCETSDWFCPVYPGQSNEHIISIIAFNASMSVLCASKLRLIHYQHQRCGISGIIFNSQVCDLLPRQDTLLPSLETGGHFYTVGLHRMNHYIPVLRHIYLTWISQKACTLNTSNVYANPILTVCPDPPALTCPVGTPCSDTPPYHCLCM